MENFYELKNRIKAINKIVKITNAMKLVSTAKLQRSKKNLIIRQPYFEIMQQIINEVFARKEENIFNKIFKKNLKNKNKIHIIITSDMGFCGSYNNLIIKKIMKNYNSKIDSIIVFGKKGKNALLKKGIKNFLFCKNISESLLLDDLRVTSSEIYNLFKKNECSMILIYYMHFVNGLKFIPTKLQVWPTQDKNKNILQDNEKQKFIPTIFEPSDTELAYELFPKYFLIILYGAIINARVSENSSRRNTMDNATENANEIIDNLKIKSNQVRQALITREIIDIIGGSINE